jgi:mRNA-degrading endonuclease RelE of RelBE toxin-antitoxin system
MQIEYSKKFIKEFKKCPNDIKKYLKEKLNIFIINKYDSRLNNHPPPLENLKSIEA